ncbi:MAG TPA: hypothetical protein VGP90_13545 [Acidimicrobiia bacterium]|nr:hypothetical protein [Acidimicrobiia bacterium]
MSVFQDPSGFVVDWQLAEDAGPVIDLSTDHRDGEVVLPEPGLVTSAG